MAEKKVVLVANEGSPLQSLKDALKKGGYSVTTCTGGFDALDVLASKGADLVVSATNLADLSGYQLSCLIKSSEKTSRLPVVLVNAEGNGQQPFWSAAAQADGVLTSKDLKGSNDKLLKMLEGLMDKAQQSGFMPELVKSGGVVPGSFSSGDLVASYGHLVGNLLVERLVGRIARSIMNVVEPRKKFVDQYIAHISSLLNMPVLGIAVASSSNPWAAFHLAVPISKKSFDSMVSKMSKQLESHKDFSLDVRGDLKEDDGKDIGTIEVLPVKSDKATLGGLIFASTDKKAFDEVSREAMAQLQVQMQPVMRLLLANQEIESLYQREQYRASTDPLTGLYNLEFLVGFLQQQLLFSYRQRAPVGLVILDLDNFKDVNDEFGYEIGDLVLSTIANRLLNQTRSSDLIARYGGDEFVIVLPNTDLAGAKVLAEKIRMDVQNMTFVKGANRKGPSITASIGCAAFNMEDLNPEVILRDAKMAIQRAKDGGRNRVSS